MSEVAIKCSTGLGDIVILAGAVEYLSKEYDRVYVPCMANNYISTCNIHKHNKKVYPVVVGVKTHGLGEIDFSYLNNKNILNGIFSYNRSLSFAENYYKNLGLDYSIRFDCCPIQKACSEYITGKPEEEFVFVHDDMSRGYRINPRFIDGKNIVRPIGKDNFLEYANYITYAKEIHCIDSAFLHFAESILTTGKLFFHEYSRPGGTRRVREEPFCPSRKQWTIYPQSEDCFLGDNEDCCIDISVLSDDDIEIARKTVRKNEYFFQNKLRCLENKKRIELVNFIEGRKEYRTKFLILGVNGKIVRIIPIEPKVINVYKTNIFYNPGDIQV